ncbi:MAG: lysine--tRNA ligase [Candidatus Dormibacteria bacterium]
MTEEVQPRDLREQRVAKLDALRASGIEPFALHASRTHSVSEALKLLGAAQPSGQPEVRSEPVSVAGRVMRHRNQGKAGFADIVDGTGKLQVYVHLDLCGPDVMDLYASLDLGDIIGVTGPVFRTRRGEPSIDVTGLTMLTKALRPLPDKWHGLKDSETRYRSRHVDLIVNPEVANTLRLRSAIITHIRRFLDGRGFIEVETPVLHKVAGGAAARPFLTHHNTLDLDLKLRIALELHLKRLVVGGLERVYEIGRVFRNEGISPRHNPEFTLLELYEAYSDCEGMMELTEALVRSTAAAAAEFRGDEGAPPAALSYRGEEIDMAPPFARREMLELVAAACPGIDIENVASLRTAARNLGAVGHDQAEWGALIYEIFERAVETTLRRPTFVTGFPVEVSPLARRRPSEPRLTERFELFIGGQELANAFSELTDPIDQRARFEQQVRARAAGDDEAHPMDEEFIAALEQGMPPTGGLGIGIDRLVSLLADAPSLRDVIAFPLLRDAPAEAD